MQAQAIHMRNISRHMHFTEQHFNNSKLSVAIYVSIERRCLKIVNEFDSHTEDGRSFQIKFYYAVNTTELRYISSWLR